MKPELKRAFQRWILSGLAILIIATVLLLYLMQEGQLTALTAGAVVLCTIAGYLLSMYCIFDEDRLKD